MRPVLLLTVLIAVTVPLSARQRLSGLCQQGGVTANLSASGLSYTVNPSVQGSYPGCNVTVYQAGTTQLATIYADNNGTPLSNPFTADAATGFFYFYADNSISKATRLDIMFSGGGIYTPFTYGDFSAFDPLAPYVAKTQNQIQFAAQFPGSDCGAQVNTAYASLPITGGVIIVEKSCTFTTPITFTTNNKAGTLVCYPGGAVNMQYSGSGTAVTLDYGTGLTMGKGIQGCTISGPGRATNTIGVQVGQFNGAQGTEVSNFKIQSFGTNIKFGNQTWIVKFDHGLIRDGNTNVLFPSSAVGAGENIQWDHVTFADAPSPFTNSVWIQAGEHKFTDCSFDQAQLTIGNGSVSNGLVSLFSPHFENPNFAQTGPTWYDFLSISSHTANHVAMYAPFFNQDNFTPPPMPEFISMAGGQLYIYGLEMFTPVGPVTNLITANGTSNVTIYGVNDLSGQLGHLVGGNSTGYLVQFPGTNNGQLSGFNNVIGPNAGTNRGGGTFDITGQIRSTYSPTVPGSGQIVTSVPTGTEPILVGSQTPVHNLVANVALYDATGAIHVNNHMVEGSVSMISSPQTVTLVAPAAFSNSFSYFCSVASNNANAAAVQYVSGTSFAVLGTVGDVVSYLCAGT